MKVPIDFVISNPGHHVATFDPVVRQLHMGGVEAGGIRFVSFCELRGMRTPADLPITTESIVRIFPSGIRSSPSNGKQFGQTGRFLRKLARRLLARNYLRGRIESWLKSRPALVVLPNDVAFPYDIVCAALRSRAIPFVLVQEGIRFPFPNSSQNAYGSGGAVRVAAWGRASAKYFRDAGVQDPQLALTGCPRFDQITERDWVSEAQNVREGLKVEGKIVALLTNPIDDQGFCTTREKLDLVKTLVSGLKKILEQEGCTLVVKLHARESSEDYRKVFEDMPGRLIRVVDGLPLYPLLATSAAALTMASTTGLEALLFNLPLAAIRLPNAGYVHDYVSEGVAWKMDASESPFSQLQQMLGAPEQRREAAGQYLDRHIAVRTGSGRMVADLIASIV